MITLIENLYTSGNELETADGKTYVGWYHILDNGDMMTGNIYNPVDSKLLVPINFLPINNSGELISMYIDGTDSFRGTYSTFAVKNYKNDIDIVRDIPAQGEFPPIKVTDQPQLFFKKNTTRVYTPGAELFVDENRTVRVRKGMPVELQFGYESVDEPENIRFEWVDSFDRVVSTESTLLLDTSTIDAEQDTFFCTVSDSYGSDFTDDITVIIVDPSNNPVIYKNIIKNGSGNQGTADWETVGESPEETGKFLASYEEGTDPNQINVASGRGSYFYHKFKKGWDALENKNQWYPRPEYFDRFNRFRGSVLLDIDDNYFRAGVFLPVLRNSENDHSGTTKNSSQVIDLTEHADLIDGKVYGISGFRTILFGWIGSRADQADTAKCEFTYLNENDEEIPTPAGQSYINGPKWFNRIANVDYQNPNIAWLSPRNSSLFTGIRTILFDYSGIQLDGNLGVAFDRYSVDIIQPDSSILNLPPEIKTTILGRTSDAVELPIGTRKIVVTKTYVHEPGVADLIWNGEAWEESGKDYISDTMMVGLNVRLYPILLNLDGTRQDTGILNNGRSVIKEMDYLERVTPTGEESQLASAILQGQTLSQYYSDQEMRLESVTVSLPAGQGSELQSTPIFMGRTIDTNIGPGSYPDVLALGDFYAQMNDILYDYVINKIEGNKLHEFILKVASLPPNYGKVMVTDVIADIFFGGVYSSVLDSGQEYATHSQFRLPAQLGSAPYTLTEYAIS